MGRLIDAEQTKLMLSELLEVAKKENFTAEDAIDHACEWIDRLPTACNPGIIAEYIKEKHPSLLQSADFTLYQITYTARKCVDMFVDAIKGVDWGELAKYAKEQEEGTK